MSVNSSWVTHEYTTKYVIEYIRSSSWHPVQTYHGRTFPTTLPVDSFIYLCNWRTLSTTTYHSRVIYTRIKRTKRLHCWLGVSQMYRTGSSVSIFYCLGPKFRSLRPRSRETRIGSPSSLCNLSLPLFHVGLSRTGVSTRFRQKFYIVTSSSCLYRSPT